MLGTYLVVCFVFSRNAGFMVELGGVIKTIYDRKCELEEHQYVVVFMLGRFKSDSEEMLHLMMEAFYPIAM